MSDVTLFVQSVIAVTVANLKSIVPGLKMRWHRRYGLRTCYDVV